MARTVTAAFKTELTASANRPFVAAYFNFSEGAIRVHSGRGAITIGGQSFTGLGDLLSVDFGGESSRGEVQTASAVISGIPSGTLTDVLSDDYKHRDCSFYFGFFDSSWAVVSDPWEWAGKMDVAVIEEGGESSVVTITANSRHSELRRPAGTRRTHEDQNARFSGDTGLQWVSQLLDGRQVGGTRVNTIPINTDSFSGGTEEDLADVINP